MDNLYLKKYLKYKSKYEKIKGGGDTRSPIFEIFIHEINTPILQHEDNAPKIKKYFNFMKKCIQFSNDKQLSDITIRKYVDCVKNFHITQQLKRLTTGGYNIVFKNPKLPECIYLRAKEPTYNFDEINLLINLNDINEKHGVNIFTPFHKIIFDTYTVKYYLEFKLYTSDLYTYLRKICYKFKLNKDKLIELFESINKILNEKLNILLGIDYLCLDIKLQNILISYDETNFDISEIVLHDFDMIACCNISKLICYKYDHTAMFMLIYYKLILFYESYKIIKSIPEIDSIPEIKSLFQDDLNSNSIEDFKNFFNYFIYKNRYTLDDYEIPDLFIEEKMHLYFHHYILNLIKQSNPEIISTDAKESDYGHLLPTIFKDILNGDIILYE